MAQRKMGGYRATDPGNKSGDYFRNPTVLKILCSISCGNITKKQMQRRIITVNQLKKQYLSTGTLNKFLSGGKRFNPEDGRLTELKDMVKEGLLLVVNKNKEFNKRLTRSKEAYKYAVNYDVIIDRFISDVNKQTATTRDTVDQLIADSSSRIWETQDRKGGLQNSHKFPSSNKKIPFLTSSDIKIKDFGRKDIIGYEPILLDSLSSEALTKDVFKERIKEYQRCLLIIKISNNERLLLIAFFYLLFANYFYSGRESLTLSDIFRIAQTQIVKGKVNVVDSGTSHKKCKVIGISTYNGCNEGIFLRLKTILDVIQDIEYFDLWMQVDKPLAVAAPEYKPA